MTNIWRYFVYQLSVVQNSAVNQAQWSLSLVAVSGSFDTSTDKNNSPTTIRGILLWSLFNRSNLGRFDGRYQLRLLTVLVRIPLRMTRNVQGRNKWRASGAAVGDRWSGTGVRCQNSGVRGPRLGVQCLESVVRGSWSGVRGPGSGVRGPWFGVRGPGSEARG